ncbi:MAG: hypothetical protein RI894_2506 [Bacteroidota bacterium]|jgi:hypothetical protein
MLLCQWEWVKDNLVSFTRVRGTFTSIKCNFGLHFILFMSRMPYRAFTTIKASLACFYFVHVKFFVQRAALNSKFALLRAKILRKTCPSYHLHVPDRKTQLRENNRYMRFLHDEIIFRFIRILFLGRQS